MADARADAPTTAERVVNLLAVLCRRAQDTPEPVESSWLIERIPGYGEQKDPGRRVHLDALLLKKAGAPIEILSQAGQHTRYRLNDTDEQQAPIRFTPEEAQVVALAAKLGTGTQISALSRAGWIKIAASAEHLTEASNVRALGDDATISGGDYERILKAITTAQAISFQYQPNEVASPVQRRMEPWHIIGQRDRHYLVGFDLDRHAPRSFRITRINAVSSLKHDATQPRPDVHEAAKILRAQLDRSKQKVTVQFASSGSNALTEGARDLGTHFELVDANRDHFIRTAASLAPEVVVLSPADVRSDVVALLRQACEQEG